MAAKLVHDRLKPAYNELHKLKCHLKALSDLYVGPLSKGLGFQDDEFGVFMRLVRDLVKVVIEGIVRVQLYVYEVHVKVLEPLDGHFGSGLDLALLDSLTIIKKPEANPRRFGQVFSR